MCLQEMFRFFTFTLLLHLGTFLIAAMPHWQHGRMSSSETVFRVTSTLIAAFPIAAPTVILGANGACTQRLRGKRIDVLNPAKLKTIADVDVVGFYKTVTLTGCVVSLPDNLCRTCLDARSSYQLCGCHKIMCHHPYYSMADADSCLCCMGCHQQSGQLYISITQS